MSSHISSHFITKVDPILCVITSNYVKFLDSLNHVETEALFGLFSSLQVPDAQVDALRVKARSAGWIKVNNSVLSRALDRIIYVPPEPTLVGVETNPGPTPLQELTAGIGAAVGAAIAKTTKKKPAAKKAAKPAQAASSNPKPRRKARNRSNETATLGGVSNHLSNMTLARAPVSGGYSYNTRAAKRNPIISVPFNSVTNSTLSSLSTATPTIGFSITATTLTSFYDLSPVVNQAGGFQTAAFGVGVSNMAKCFSKWRMKKLMVTYIPCVSTATAGSLAIGATGENYLGTSPTFQQVTDCERMVVTPVWQAASVDITSIANNGSSEWLYVYASGATVAEQRQNYCCSLMLATFGLPAPAATKTDYGQFRFDGEIEFTDMSDIVGGVQTTVENKQSGEEHKEEELREIYVEATPEAPTKRGWLI